MREITIQKVNDPAKQTLPIFADIAQRFDVVRKRAHELFENRGGELGDALQDWLTAEREVFGWTAAELSETEKAYQIEFALAGFDAKDVQVTATPGEIIVRAAIKEENKVEKEKVLWTEFGSKDICRRFELPNPIDTEKVTATLEKSILRINAPKADATKEKTLAIASAA